MKLLQLTDICKDYPGGENTVHALRGISLQFRESEFVSILGPSGCGKTTMLNIIGGLDQYTSGDLVIDGKSTKKFKDRDWDSYRNHSVGFVFQNYNLIPHQNVLQNVELALSLSGVPKQQRRLRAKKALEQVGLGDQLRKKPGEMSGGQMQRVAIARALVNDPDIILADEPTGALDTQTSIQVMEILKEISKDRLVVMVTHNPELAEQYSTRIIRMLDGKITDDSAPLAKEEPDTCVKKEAVGKRKKPSMSLFTSFSLSLKNLISKKGRTILTSFAGSIGIIGIALIFAMSQGMTYFINTVQEDTLASYPLSIEATTVDLTTLMNTFMDNQEENLPAHENDGIYARPALSQMINALNSIETTENDLISFKKYIESELQKEDSSLSQALSGVQYTYDLDLQVYTENTDGTVIRSDTQKLLREAIAKNMGMDMTASVMPSTAFSGLGTMSSRRGSQLWCEMLPGKDGSIISPLLKKQYDCIVGTWPSAYDEIVLVVDKNNELSDMTLYALGLESEEEIDRIFQSVTDGTELEITEKKWSYEDVLGLTFRVIQNADCYVKSEETGLYTDLRLTEAGTRYLYDHGMDLKVVGILRPNEKASSAMLTGSIAYTSALTRYVVENAKGKEALEAQLADNEMDIFTGLPFKENSSTLTDTEKEAAFRAHIEKLSDSQKAELYVRVSSIPTEEELAAAVEQNMAGMDREQMEQTLITALLQQMSVSEDQIREYVADMSQEDLQDMVEKMIRAQYAMQKAQQVQMQLSGYPEAQLTAMLEQAMETYTPEQYAAFYDGALEFSDSTYEENLIALGCVELSDPLTINLYASTFENKDVIEAAIRDYNSSVDELQEIHYTDYVGIMMKSVTTIINAITYVLIAFVATSLVVSSVMIGVITLISVQERTKEIGILRAIGASKRNVSTMFNVETAIIGLSSGLMGVLITYLLCIPINAIVHALTGLNNLSAQLPIPIAAALIAISVMLTLISGIIPSRSAAKKDPVVALRTE